jgi:drug/metabolite transporter (DMT)-like permease
MNSMKTTQNTRAGIWFMIATTFVFAMQDGISRHLAAENSIYMVVMLRFWFFAAVVSAIAARAPEGFRAAVATKHLGIQLVRGPLLAIEVCVMVLGFAKLGLIESHAAFTCAPLLVAALSGPILGEKVGWRRWLAIGVGFVGVLVILQPGVSVFSPWALVPLLAALLFAIYALLTRSVARGDSASVSFFWTGVTGAIAMTPMGLYSMHQMSAPDWGWMALLCCTALLGHNLFIRAYAVAEASAVQPFAYFQLAFASVLAMVVFNESVQLHVIIGAVIVVSAGLFTLWRQRVNERRAARASGPSTRT